MEMYADIGTDIGETPQWVKIAHRRSNPVVMCGKVRGKSEFPSRR